jgi:hypothetical protein
VPRPKRRLRGTLMPAHEGFRAPHLVFAPIHAVGKLREDGDDWQGSEHSRRGWHGIAPSKLMSARASLIPSSLTIGANLDFQKIPGPAKHPRYRWPAVAVPNRNENSAHARHGQMTALHWYFPMSTRSSIRNYTRRRRPRFRRVARKKLAREVGDIYIFSAAPSHERFPDRSFQSGRRR